LFEDSKRPTINYNLKFLANLKSTNAKQIAAFSIFPRKFQRDERSKLFYDPIEFIPTNVETRGDYNLHYFAEYSDVLLTPLLNTPQEISIPLRNFRKDSKLNY
jgi:hypothetical protein